MQVTTLHEIEAELAEVDHDTLREMAFQLARSHVAVCELTSTVGDCAHISVDDIRDRVDGLTNSQLASLLAATAWLSIDLHTRLGE